MPPKRKAITSSEPPPPGQHPEILTMTTAMTPEEQHIKRPPNMFIAFLSFMVSLFHENGIHPPMQIARPAIAKAWETIKTHHPQVKVFFEGRAEIVKTEHGIIHPNYKYQPRRNITRKRQEAVEGGPSTSEAESEDQWSVASTSTTNTTLPSSEFTFHQFNLHKPEEAVKQMSYKFSKELENASGAAQPCQLATPSEQSTAQIFTHYDPSLSTAPPTRASKGKGSQGKKQKKKGPRVRLPSEEDEFICLCLGVDGLSTVILERANKEILERANKKEEEEEEEKEEKEVAFSIPEEVVRTLEERGMVLTKPPVTIHTEAVVSTNVEDTSERKTKKARKTQARTRKTAAAGGSTKQKGPAVPEASGSGSGSEAGVAQDGQSVAQRDEESMLFNINDWVQPQGGPSFTQDSMPAHPRAGYDTMPLDVNYFNNSSSHPAMPMLHGFNGPLNGYPSHGSPAGLTNGSAPSSTSSSDLNNMFLSPSYRLYMDFLNHFSQGNPESSELGTSIPDAFAPFDPNGFMEPQGGFRPVPHPGAANQLAQAPLPYPMPAHAADFAFYSQGLPVPGYDLPPHPGAANQLAQAPLPYPMPAHAANFDFHSQGLLVPRYELPPQQEERPLPPPGPPAEFYQYPQAAPGNLNVVMGGHVLGYAFQMQ